MKIIIECTPKEFFDLVKTQDQTEKSGTSNPFISERAKSILAKLPRTVVTDDYLDKEFCSYVKTDPNIARLQKLIHKQLQEMKSLTKSKDE